MKKAIKNIKEFSMSFILCLMLLGSPSIVFAQQRTVLSSSRIHSFNFDFNEQKSSLDVNIQKRSRSIGWFPIIFYSDETRWAGGAGIQVVYPGQSEKYSSSIGLIGFYTQNKQYVVQVTPEIYFKEGEMAHAVSDNHTGEEAVFELLSWEAGSFQVKMGAEPPTRTINKGWSGLLLEGMRRIDEATAGWSPEWEEASESPVKDPNDNLEVRIAKALTNIRDVDSALILSSDGAVIAQDKTDDPVSDQALGEMIKNKAEQLA